MKPRIYTVESLTQTWADFLWGFILTKNDYIICKLDLTVVRDNFQNVTYRLNNKGLKTEPCGKLLNTDLAAWYFPDSYILMLLKFNSSFKKNL